MKMVIVRKVAYRLPKSNRLVWALVLAERQGLTLLFVRKPDGKRSDELVIATENFPEKVFEPVNTFTFPLEQSDLTGIGDRLNALGDESAENEFERMLKSEGLL